MSFRCERMPRWQQGQKVLERDVGEQTSGNGGQRCHYEYRAPEATRHETYLAKTRAVAVSPAEQMMDRLL